MNHNYPFPVEISLFLHSSFNNPVSKSWSVNPDFYSVVLPLSATIIKRKRIYEITGTTYRGGALYQKREDAENEIKKKREREREG